MARKDILLRYAQAEHEYLEMSDLVKDLDTELKNGLIDQDYYNDRIELIEDEVEATKKKYFFWGEVVYELNRPRRKKNTLDDTTQAWYNAITSETREILVDESKDPFKVLKQVLSEGKLANNE